VPSTCDIGYAARIGLRYINSVTFENSKAGSSRELISILREEFTADLLSEVLCLPPGLLSSVLIEDDELRMWIRTGYKETDDH
jgi:hypothetical protein